MGPTWVLLAPGGPHDGPMNLEVRVHVFSKISLVDSTFEYALMIWSHKQLWPVRSYESHDRPAQYVPVLGISTEY